MHISLDAQKSVDNYTDLDGFQTLKAESATDPKAVLPVVAKQFESLFTSMMLKSMREASGEDSVMGSQTEDQWRDMYDQQLSIQLSQGKGIGIAQMLVKQLSGSVTSTATGADKAEVASVDDDWRSRLNTAAGKAKLAVSSALKQVPQDAADFVNQLEPYAKSVAAKLGVSVRAVLAQVALETHWGQHMPTDGAGNSSNNLFGMKAGSSWGGARVTVPTTEVEDGYAVRRLAEFRAYRSPADSFKDYAEQLANNPRYASALNRGDDVEGFASGLVKGGYATDPYYVQKLTAIANSPALKEALEELKKVVDLPITSE